MIGNQYWTTGIKIRRHADGRWSLGLDYYDDGFANKESTEGTLRVRYVVEDIERAVRLLKADADRLGISFRAPNPDMTPTIYWDDEENPDVPGEHLQLVQNLCALLGWRCCYTDREQRLNHERPAGPIIRAAVRIGDRVFTAWRHHQAIQEAVKAGATKHVDQDAQGFVTQNGRFLSRAQAKAYALYTGQVTELPEGPLLSEYLWDSDGNPLEHPPTKEKPSQLDAWEDCPTKVAFKKADGDDVSKRQKPAAIPELRMRYPRKQWSRGAAWNHLLQHPPKLTLGKTTYVPHTEPKFNPYRKDHDETSWGWLVVAWSEG